MAASAQPPHPWGPSIFPEPLLGPAGVGETWLGELEMPVDLGSPQTMELRVSMRVREQVFPALQALQPAARWQGACRQRDPQRGSAQCTPCWGGRLHLPTGLSSLWVENGWRVRAPHRPGR